MTYNGVRITVPATWPVIDLRLHPSTCVRLDQPALYLGSPGSQSDCPAHAVGRADTLWLRTVTAGQQAPVTSQVATVGALAAHVAVDPVGHDKQAQFVAQAVELEATWGADSSSIDRVLASAAASGPSTPAPAPLAPAATRPSTAVLGAAAPRAVAPATVTSAIAVASTFTGMAFDACGAPSTSTMGSWMRFSPYGAAGIYIGGSMRACGDGNLSASWVAQVKAMGWGLLPIYVGPQAPCVNQGGLAHISGSQAAAQGRANADDAVSRAQAFGMSAGTPVYYDMESYDPAVSGCSQTVVTFISGWTSELHRLGYRSGAYGSPGSLMTDLSSSVGSGIAVPDDIWFAHWNGLKNTTDQSNYPRFPDADWSGHHRVHQYAGGSTENWGGVSVNIDANWVDADVAGQHGGGGGGAPPVTNGSFVRIAGHAEIYRIAGGAPTYVSTWAAFGGAQPVIVMSQASFDALAAVPANGTFVVGSQSGQVYRVAGGAPVYVSTWTAFGGAQPVMAIDQAAIERAGAGGAWNHLRSRPADGTFVVEAQTGQVYRVAGGAPVYVSTWTAFGGAQPVVAIDQVAIERAGGGGVWSHLGLRPADGTFVVEAQTGQVYRVAGGAPVYVSTWTAFGGARPVVAIDQVAIERAGGGGAWSHLSLRPANGTFVVGAQSGQVYRFAGGAPMFVSTWTPFGGPHPTVVVDQTSLDHAGGSSGALSHVLLRPADGTFLLGVPSSRVFLVSGGVATLVPSWTPYGGPKPAVAVNDADLDNAGAQVPWQHLISATPVSTLNALPSFTTSAQVALSWTSPVSAAALTSFDLRWQSATPTTAFTPWQYPAGWNALTGTSVGSQAMAVGGTYCYSVRAHNLATQTGPWSPARCITRPTDDRTFAASSGWVRPAADALFYVNTYSSSTSTGATLTLTGTRVSRLALLATRCPVCGTVGLYVGTTLVGTVNLAAPTTQHQVLWMIPPFSYRTGAVTVKVLSSGRLVQIDGVAISAI